MALYRYSRWDGSQTLFLPDEDDLLGELSSQLMAHGDLAAALRSLMQRGTMDRSGRRIPGLQDLLQRLRAMRQQTLERYDLDSVLENIAQRLQDVVDTEREGIQRRLHEMTSRMESLEESLPRKTAQELLERMGQQASRSLEFLDRLPPDPAARLRQLYQYEFMDPEARAKFDELVRSLQRQTLDSYLRDLHQRVGGLDPQGVQGLKEMVRDLNRMLEQRLRGEASAGFQAFLQKHGHLLGQEPSASLDDLVERLRRQLSHLHDLVCGMSAAQRQEFQQLLEAALQDPELREEVRWLSANLEALASTETAGREYRFHGGVPLTLEEALSVMERLHKMEETERQLRGAQQGGSIADVDGELLKELLGEGASGQLEQLKGLTKVLEEAGYVRRIGDRYELTPRGVRKIGQKALQEIFVIIRKGRVGGHIARSPGTLGEEQREDTKRYEDGDAFDPDLYRTLMNAMQRGDGVPLRIRPEDFEVFQPRHVSQAATVLMVDLSLSMAMRGNFTAAKKVAMALDNLIRAQFPRDTLHIVGFSTYAREVKPDKLPYLTWDEFEPYTNIQHGLILSQKLLSKASGSTTRQIIMISDGEPTAHLEGGQLFLQYPPSPRTIRETLREVKRCTTKNIVINTFMLDRNAYLVDFVEQLTRINRGRVFYTSAERLGQYILVDYFTSRRRVLG